MQVEPNKRDETEFEKKCLQLMELQDFEALAQACAEHLERTSQRSFKGYLYLGVAYFKQQDFEQAMAFYRKAEELNPQHAQLKYNMGLAEFKQENITNAKEYFQQCIELD